MKIKENFISFFYLISFISFYIFVFLYIPRPKLKKFLPLLNNKDKVITSNINFDNKLSSKMKRKISIGQSYFVFLKNKLSFEVTPISMRNIKNFNLSYLTEYLPLLIIDADRIKTLNVNNYGIEIGSSILQNRYQACLFDIHEPSFLYEFDTSTTYRYNDYDYWGSIFKNEIWALIKNVRSDNINCLLITSTNSEIFENEKNIIRIISNNFLYE